MPWYVNILGITTHRANTSNSSFFKNVQEKVIPHTHLNHNHVHGIKCGHTAIRHGDHVDYLHDGHLHHQGKNEVIEEHVLAVAATNPATCTGGHACNDHPSDHVHDSGCDHEAVPHGDHVDYLVDGHLHYQHNGHCDNHGPVFFG